MKIKEILLVFSLSLILMAAACLVTGLLPVACAQGPDGFAIYYVAEDCSGVSGPCYTTVQAAVDAVDDSGDEVWVATGTYADVNSYGSTSQVVYIDRSLTLRGGYGDGFSLWDPDVYTTTLDAQGSGRVVRVAGNAVTVTLEGLEITNGKTDFLGGDGAGVCVSGATVVISGCQIHGNAIQHDYASYDHGAGLALLDADGSIVSNNQVHANGDAGTLVGGGGIYVDRCDDCLIEDNEIHDNRACRGGGLEIEEADPIAIRGNAIYGNVADRLSSANERGEAWPSAPT